MGERFKKYTMKEYLQSNPTSANISTKIKLMMIIDSNTMDDTFYLNDCRYYHNHNCINDQSSFMSVLIYEMSITAKNAKAYSDDLNNTLALMNLDEECESLWGEYPRKNKFTPQYIQQVINMFNKNSKYYEIVYALDDRTNSLIYGSIPTLPYIDDPRDYEECDKITEEAWGI